MVDQELDALLVGALYGELGPADEARLAAHLESHPTDRTALDDMRTTRKAMADARFFELWFEPPASVSALLVQEAARRAPLGDVVGESWFSRFARSFMRHPAMAAAAMLVVVVGVAGTLYMKTNSDLAAPRAANETAAPAAVAAGSASTQSYGYATETPPTVAATTPTGNAKAESSDGISADVDDKSVALERSREVAKPTASRAIKQGQAIEVEPKNYEPKDLAKDHVATLSDRDSADQPQQEQQQPAKRKADKADSEGKESDHAYKGNAAPAPASAPQAPQTAMATVGAVSTGAGGAAAGSASGDPVAADEHERVRSLVSVGRCTDAANEAAKIEARSPDYYADNVANDIKLKPCISYIANAVEQQQATRSKAAAKAARANQSK